MELELEAEAAAEKVAREAASDGSGFYVRVVQAEDDEVSLGASGSKGFRPPPFTCVFRLSSLRSNLLSL